jgi:hypothetical protein
MRFREKFTGKDAGTLAKPGDCVVLAPCAEYLVDLAQGSADFYHTFTVQDLRGNYAQFVATVPYRGNPEMTLSQVACHVGAPLNQGSKETIARVIEAAVRKDREDLTIVQNFIGQGLEAPEPLK